jgi:hypothetical protein
MTQHPEIVVSTAPCILIYMDELTMTKTSRSTATVMQGGVAVGHLGMMCHGSMCFINMSFTHGLSSAAHVSSLEDALTEANKMLARKLEREEAA